MALLQALPAFAGEIRLKRGPEANLPATAATGEPLFTTDTFRFFLGTGTGLQEYSKTGHLHFNIYEPADSRLQGHLVDMANPHGVYPGQIGAEPSLGLPAADGLCVKSYQSGVRYFEDCGGTGSSESRTSIVNKLAETPPDNTLPLVYKDATGTELFSVDPATGTVTIHSLVIK